MKYLHIYRVVMLAIDVRILIKVRTLNFYVGAIHTANNTRNVAHFLKCTFHLKKMKYKIKTYTICIVMYL